MERYRVRMRVTKQVCFVFRFLASWVFTLCAIKIGNHLLAGLSPCRTSGAMKSNDLNYTKHLVINRRGFSSRIFVHGLMSFPFFLASQTWTQTNPMKSHSSPTSVRSMRCSPSHRRCTRCTTWARSRRSMTTRSWRRNSSTGARRRRHCCKIAHSRLLSLS